MKIKAKIFWILSSMSLLVAFVGVLAVNRQHVAATIGAAKEAENVARLVGFLFSETGNFSPSAQKIIAKLHESEGRDVVLLDTNQLILADIMASNTGKIFTEDPGDIVGATLRDGQTRIFIETGSASPMKQIVMPVRNHSGQIFGAVVLEYAPLYDELMQTTRATTRQVILAGLVSVLIALLIAFYMGRSIARPLHQLAEVATGFAAGKIDVPMPRPRKDEIGELAEAFNRMVQKRKLAEDDLRHARDELEIRVAERTAELAKANEELQAENSERKRMEETLRESEEKFRQLAENITDVFWITSPDMQSLHYVSPAYERVWGRSIKSLYSDPRQWLEAILPEERERVLAIFASLGTEKPSASMEYRIMRADGTVRWLHDRGFVVRNAAGEVIRHAGMATDITERKQNEENLRLLGSAVQQAKESIVITDAELDLPGPKILFVNSAFTKMTGYTAREVIGKTPRLLQGPRTDKAVLSRLRQNLENGEIFEGEAINYRKDGEEFDLEWQVAPLRDAHGHISHFVAIQRDITERKRLENKLFQSQKMETVGKLAGGIAHEFNSIMTAIIGQSELILNDLPPENPLRENVAEVRKAADRAAILTHQLLAFGRKQILQPEIIDLNAILIGMKSILIHLVGKNVDVRVTSAVGLKAVKADAGQIEQVIVNIVMNAADAMPNGGRLTLETANAILDESYASRFPELKAGEYVMLAITDTGAGMSDRVKARVFEPFFTTKGVGEGTGLGLATCHGIVKQSGGHIAVYSEPGRGTTFKIYLPAIEQEPKVSIQHPTSTNLPRGTETILLVEDDPALRTMASALLRRLGYTVLTAANGVDALSLTHQKDIGHIDLLFTDVVMPHMSGKELADRAQQMLPKTRILFTSAYTESAIVHQGVLNPGVELLQKPFTPSMLARKVREMLDLH